MLLERGEAVHLPAPIVELPHLDGVVAAAGGELLDRRIEDAGGCDEGAWGGGGGPGDGGDADGVGLVDAGGFPGSVGAGGEDGDVAVGGAAGEAEAEVVWGPGDGVNGGFVLGEEVGLGPVVGGGGILLPDDDAAVVGAGGEDGSELGVGPGDLPDGALVAGEGGEVLLLAAAAAAYADDLDGGVGGGCGEALAVVVHRHIVDHVVVARLDFLSRHLLDLLSLSLSLIFMLSDLLPLPSSLSSMKEGLPLFIGWMKKIFIVGFFTERPLYSTQLLEKAPLCFYNLDRRDYFCYKTYA